MEDVTSHLLPQRCLVSLDTTLEQLEHTYTE